MSILDERIGWQQDHISSLRKEINETLPWYYSTTFLGYIGGEESPAAAEESRILLEEAQEKGILDVGTSSYSDNLRSFLFALTGFDNTEDRTAFLLRIPTATKLALEQGVFKEDDPDYFIKSMIVTEYALDIEKKKISFSPQGAQKHIEDNLDYYVDGDDLALKNMELSLSFGRANKFLLSNHPLTYYRKFNTAFTGDINSSAFRASNADVIKFVRSMTRWGQHLLLSELDCPEYFRGKLLDAINRGDEEQYISICSSEHLTLTTPLSSTIGYILILQEILDKSMANLIDYCIEVDTPIDKEVQQIIVDVEEPALKLMGSSVAEFEGLITHVKSHDAVLGEFFSHPLAEEEINSYASFAISYHFCSAFFDCLDDDELEEINRILTPPGGSELVRFAQFISYISGGNPPKKLKLLISKEECDKICSKYPEIFKDGNQKEQEQSADVVPVGVEKTGHDEGTVEKEKNNKSKSNAGAPRKTWIIGTWTEDEVNKIIKDKIWTGVVKELKDFTYPEKSNNEKGEAILASGAAIIIYCAHNLKLTDIQLCNAPAARTFEIMKAPKTTINSYLKRLHGWYSRLVELSSSPGTKTKEKITNLALRWRREDNVRAGFIIDNYEELKKLINNTSFTMSAAFGLNIDDLNFIVPEEKSDSALYGAVEYKDDIELRDDGSVSKTGVEMSDNN